MTTIFFFSFPPSFLPSFFHLPGRHPFFPMTTHLSRPPTEQRTKKKAMIRPKTLFDFEEREFAPYYNCHLDQGMGKVIVPESKSESQTVFIENPYESKVNMNAVLSSVDLKDWNIPDESPRLMRKFKKQLLYQANSPITLWPTFDGVTAVKKTSDTILRTKNEVLKTRSLADGANHFEGSVVIIPSTFWEDVRAGKAGIRQTTGVYSVSDVRISLPHCIFDQKRETSMGYARIDEWQFEVPEDPNTQPPRWVSPAVKMENIYTAEILKILNFPASFKAKYLVQSLKFNTWARKDIAGRDIVVKNFKYAPIIPPMHAEGIFRNVFEHFGIKFYPGMPYTAYTGVLEEWWKMLTRSTSINPDSDNE